MNNILHAINNMVPFSQFNKGMAGKIFNDVKQAGIKIVVKNNAPECILMSTEAYAALMDIVNDAKLAAIAEERLANTDPSTWIPAEKVWEEFGITKEEVDAMEDVEIE